MKRLCRGSGWLEEGRSDRSLHDFRGATNQKQAWWSMLCIRNSFSLSGDLTWLPENTFTGQALHIVYRDASHYDVRQCERLPSTVEAESHDCRSKTTSSVNSGLWSVSAGCFAARLESLVFTTSILNVAPRVSPFCSAHSFPTISPSAPNQPIRNLCCLNNAASSLSLAH